jgi:hypothetical protein
MTEVDHTCLAAALVAALAELTTIDTNHEANAGTYSYRYADIADVVKVTRPVLASHGLAALTPINPYEERLACTVTIIHVSGERLDLGTFPFPNGRDAQATGSMVTYHRRYALVAALGMAADDDDGAAATAKQQRPQTADRGGVKVASKKDRDAIVAVFNKITDRDLRTAAKNAYLERFGIATPDRLPADQVAAATQWALDRVGAPVVEIAVPADAPDRDALMAGIRAYEEELPQDAWPTYTAWLTDQHPEETKLEEMSDSELEAIWRYLHVLAALGKPA